jgi:dTDP-glucose 4,6-dehydratase
MKSEDEIRAILVTGAAGFIGSHLVRKLLFLGHRVLAVDCLTYAGNLDSLADCMNHSGFEFLDADITDDSAMARAVDSFSPDWIFHLAAETHVDRSITEPMDFLKTNVLGTGVVLQAALAHWKRLEGARREHFRFIHISTDEVFGSLEEGGSFSENSSYQPRSPYSASKAASDHIVRAWGITYGIPVIVTNCSNNYGSYQFPEKLIPRVITHAISGKKIPVFGRGLQIRDWLHVEDHCEGLLLAAMRGIPGETYVMGGGNEWTNLALVETLCDLVGEVSGLSENFRSQIEFVADRPGHDFRYSIDFSKIRHELGWTLQRDFTEGLRETVAWYLGNRQWWEDGK